MKKFGKKITLLSALICLAAAGSANAADATTYTTTFGDVDGDSKIDVMDMENIQKDILSLTSLDDTQSNNADIDRNGIVNVVDMEGIQKNILGLELIENINVIKTNSTVSVHDPSIIKDEDTGTYYIFGSHMAWAKSTDLCNWTTFTNNINSSYATIFKDEFAWAGKAGVSTYAPQDNLWAPDIIWNEQMGKWCMYMSINGPKWNSTISLLTADSLDGTWTYVGPVIQSGMSMGYGVTFDYTKVTGEAAVNSRYTNAMRNGTPIYEPHAIDPCVLYDDNGNLWMSYGSWSGGIGMIRLDNGTGLRDYNTTYTLDAQTLTDPYTGYKIAGGNQQSGEASYIQKIDGHYYLFMSYGGLVANGGYSMRVFRSDNIYGPYVDESGDYARYMLNDNVIGSKGAGAINGSVGIKLLTYYQWSTMDVAQVAQGHNSAFVDEDGKAYVIYHTRTNDGTEGHYVKTHQLFTNEDGWLVAAPYQYSGETLNESGYNTSKVAGTYEVLMHKQSINYANLEYVAPIEITLNSNGTVSGKYTGTWSLTKDSPYITVVLGDKTYKGVVIRQIIEGTDKDTMCFTLLGVDDEVEVWGSKYLEGKRAIDITVEKMTVASIAVEDLTLPATGLYNTEITWSSDNPAVIANDGTLTKPNAETTVTLTATFKNHDVEQTKSYDVKVYESTGDSTEPYIVAKYYTNTPVDLSKAVQGTYAIPNPFNAANTSGLEIYNGAAIEFDVAHTGSFIDLNRLDTILGFTDSSGGKLYFTGGSYLGYNAVGGYFDANIQTSPVWAPGTDFIGNSAKVRIDFLPTGYQVSVNGQLAYTNTDIDNGTIKGTNTAMSEYNNILKWLNSSSTTLNLGWGSWWDAAYNGTISNIVCYAYPVEKIDTSAYAYYEGYDKANASDVWTSGGASVSTNNDGDSHGNYACLATDTSVSGNRGAYSMFGAAAQLSGKYTINLDTKLTAGVLTQRSNSGFAILGSDAAGHTGNSMVTSGYILKLENVPPQGTGANQTNTSLQDQWTINDSNTVVTIPVGEWVNINAEVDTTTKKAVITIKDATDKVLYNGTVDITGTGTLGGLQMLRGRGIGTVSVDTIKVTDNN